MGDVSKVLTGAGGLVSVAPTGTTLPTNTAATLNAAFVDVGIISDDGVEFDAKADYTDLKSWNGSIIRKIRTSFDPTFKFVMAETNKTTLALYWSGSVVAANTGESLIKIKPFETDLRAFCIDVLDGDRIIRYVAPIAEVTERQALPHRSNQGVAYGVTITCYPDTDGYAVYEYIDVDLTAS